MLASFNKHQQYLTSCSAYVFGIVLTTPQFNNYWDLCELIDIYFRKFVLENSDLSGVIMDDCKDLVNVISRRNPAYRRQVIDSFERIEDAYHFLALTTQFFRMSNLYGLISNNPSEICNFGALRNALLPVMMTC
jgi:hypothetical protein